MEGHCGEGVARAAAAECLAFRLDSDKGSLCYSGDSGGVRGTDRARAGLRHGHPDEPLP